VNYGEINIGARTPESFTLRSRPTEPSMCPLDDPSPLDFGEHAHEREHCSADRRREIEGLPEGHETHAEVLELVEERHEVSEVPSEPIEGGDGHEIESPPPGIGHESVEAGPLLAGAAHCAVDELGNNLPPRSLSMLTESPELVVRRLVVGAHPRIDGNPTRQRLADGVRGALPDILDVIQAPSVGEREVGAVLTDDDVIEDRNAEELSGGD